MLQWYLAGIYASFEFNSTSFCLLLPAIFIFCLFRQMGNRPTQLLYGYTVAKFAGHLPHRYGNSQYYLPPGRGDIPVFTPAEAGTRLSDPGGMQG